MRLLALGMVISVCVRSLPGSARFLRGSARLSACRDRSISANSGLLNHAAFLLLAGARPPVGGSSGASVAGARVVGASRGRRPRPAPAAGARGGDPCGLGLLEIDATEHLGTERTVRRRLGGRDRHSSSTTGGFAGRHWRRRHGRTLRLLGGAGRGRRRRRAGDTASADASPTGAAGAGSMRPPAPGSGSSTSVSGIGGSGWRNLVRLDQRLHARRTPGGRRPARRSDSSGSMRSRCPSDSVAAARRRMTLVPTRALDDRSAGLADRRRVHRRS